jgi:transmembrane sensor
LPNIINLRTRDRLSRRNIEAEARDWIVQFDGEASPNPKTIQEFRAWLRTTPLHRQVFEEIATVWKDLDHWSEFLDAAKSEVESGVAKPYSGPARHRYMMKFAAAGSLGALMLAGGLTYHRWFDPNAAREYKTAVGEIRSIALRDGSNVQLDTGTAVDVTYDGSFRLIHLKEGQAFFKVFHDANRPFIVYVGKYAVRAVGTAFSVRSQDGGNKLDLTVTEGRVQVAELKTPVANGPISDFSQSKNVSSLVAVVVGERLSLNEDGQIVQQHEEPARIEKDLAWRDGMLIFDNDSLEEVVSKINRYTQVRIVISDDSIRGLKFGGYFKVGDVPAILATLNQNFGLHVEKVNDRLVYLSPLKKIPQINTPD